MNKKDNVVFLVPTGVGASIGGFAGDASFWAREFSKKFHLIVNPNVVNAAVFSGINDDMSYVEGYSIDEFFKGNIALRASKNNKIGVIIDKAIPQQAYNLHINAINAVRTVYGIDILDPIVTEEEVGVHFDVMSTGVSSGSLKNPQTLIDAGNKLKAQGAQAIAIVCYFEDSEDDNYAEGIGVDPVGGVEAIISHILSKELKMPVAHAPAFESLTVSDTIVDARASAEYITPTFLPCILVGLQNAPIIIPHNEATKDDITINDIKALVMPFNCLGSIPVFKALEKRIKVFAVEENKTVLDVTAQKLNLEGIIQVETYQQAMELI